MLQAAVASVIEDKRMAAFVKEVRERLADNAFISSDEVAKIATRNYFSVDPSFIIESFLLQHDYESGFFQRLKSAHDTRFPIYYRDDSFIFRINDAWVWEEPRYGAATYLFDASKISLEELVALLKNTTRVEICYTKEIQEKSGFIRRVIHPKDADNVELVERWVREVKQQDKGVTSESNDSGLQERA
jgi:hypothetical protein